MPKDLAYVGVSAGAHSRVASRTPQGFLVSPQQARDVVWRSQRLSWKHEWEYFADSRYYYVNDTFLGKGANHAYRVGVRVDGRTGGIVDR